MKKYGFLLIPVALLVMAGSFPAGGDKELIASLRSEMLVLQRQIRDLQESFDKSQGHTSPLVQKISDNSDNTLRALTAIEEALRTSQTTQSNNLTGTNNRITRLEQQVTATDQRTAQILTQINALKTLLDQQQRCLQEKEQMEDNPQFDSPERLYAFAFGQYVKGNYAQAITYFQRYIEGYGGTEAADNARFWIAESFYNQNRFEDALRAYDRLLTDFPRSDKLASASLKKGIALLKLERRDEGVAMLRTVIAQFPRSEEAATAAEELSRLGESPQPPPAAAPEKPVTRKKPGRNSH
ncbi:MAG TPA: tetratricopeptide repeat protein [Blastocatellia bacterium]|nr:tetratricopeptide repeat protein [Blastocatellia bacterium]